MPEPKHVHFAPNIQQQLALADVDAALEGHAWGDEWYYNLTDGRILSVSEEVCRKINMLDLAPGEPFVIVKRCGANSRRPVRWDVWRAGEAEQERAAEEAPDLEEQLRRSLDQQEARKPQPPRQIPKPSPPAPAPSEPLPPAARTNVQPIKPSGARQMHFTWEESVREQSRILTDVYAETLAYSSLKHGNSVKPEDVRSLVITSYISQSQKGKRRIQCRLMTECRSRFRWNNG